MTVGKVNDFNFSSAGKAVGYCEGGMAKKGYAMGGSAKAGQSVQMAKSNAVQKTLAGQKMTPMAKGGEARLKDTIRNERQEMNRVSAKQRNAGEEMSRVRSEMRYDKNELKGMAKGGAMDSGGREMLKNRGALGVIANKNPGERANHTAPNLPGMKMAMKNGGPVIPKAGYKKIDKVMGEFKAGDLHSGSKTGPKVTGTKQAVAIALSEARRADKKAK